MFRYAIKTTRCIENNRDYHISRETFPTIEAAQKSAKGYFKNLVEVRVVKAKPVKGKFEFVA